MKKTKIICSIGPASQSPDVMSLMVKEGMNVARVNFSHGDYQEYTEILNSIKKTREVTNDNIAILYDTKGPDFRCAEMKEGGVNLVNGNVIRIIKNNCIGTENAFTVNHPEALDKINVGNTVLLEDALMKLEVISKEVDGITCRVIEGGVLNSKKGISVPGVRLDLPFMSEQDEKDIEFACMNEGDFIALSFVESRENILQVKELLKKYNRLDMKIISKVESKAGVDNLDEIIDESDGIMVARGDLGVEVPVEFLPIIQKDMIRKCREKEKFVIVATEMLASMYTSARPTRAEVTDISNAVFDGADAVMLSGESTVGRHPIEAVRYMAKICEESEKNDYYATKFSFDLKNDITEAIANSVITSSNTLNTKAIVVPTTGGHSATVISNLRPKTIIIAPCPNEKVARSLSLNYGVYPVVSKVDDNDMDDLVHHAKEVAKKILNLSSNDVIIITGGVHDNMTLKQTNFMKIEEI
ncbi:MAG: pyruvate kinase [Bacilli bacterium]|nr:pyruvate kinase [Bacilli bacterium]